MNKSIELFKSGHVSSCGTTTQWNRFYSTFKSEFRKELKKIGAQEIVFSKGHFYLSGFFTRNRQIWYFSISDVRDGIYKYGSWNLLYRTAKSYKDYSGGQNNYINICEDMWLKNHNVITKEMKIYW